MLTSMTGFGRAIFDAPFGRLTAEVQSVNRKYLEVFVSMPKEFARFEIEVRKWIGENISRGQISVRIFLNPNGEAVEHLLPDISLLKALKKGWDKAAKALKTDTDKVDLPFIMQYLPIGPKQDLGKEEDLEALRRCVKKAIEGLLKMKQAEGKALAQDLAGRLKKIERMIVEVEKLAPNAAQKMREKLQERLLEALKPGAELEERLLREVALFAERVDISEEITRLFSHIAQFEELLSPKQTSTGRKMDFLIQEMGREVNTIGAKSMEAKISHLVVELKSELEKMREQIQNIE